MHDIRKTGTWHKIKIKDRTVRVLKNGIVIPTWNAMQRQILKF